MPRLATTNDLPAILRLAERKVYPTWRSQGPQDTSPAFLRGLVQSADWTPDYELVVAEEAGDIAGFLLLKKQLIMGITGDRESVVQDSFAPQMTAHRELLNFAAEAARNNDSQFLTAAIPPDDGPNRDLLESLGFQLESHKISVTTAECRMPEASPYSVRPVEPGDDFLISVLNSTVLAETLCAGRDYNLSELTFRSMGTTMERVSRVDPNFAGLVLTLGEQMIGYLLIELHDRSGYIYDLALEREHWGGTAVRHIMRAGSRLLFQKGIPLFVGDVSASNRRALVVAQRALGFSVDRLRYGLKL